VTSSQPVPPVASRGRLPASSSSVTVSDHHAALGEADGAVRKVGLTIYGCGQDEAAVFREVAQRFGITTTITESPASEANIGLAFGTRCISVGHKTRIADSTLLALRRAGVQYLSTRSVGYNHINLEYAEKVGLTVENVAYSPDSVADYTLMLMLMMVRHARSIIGRADGHDYRLHDRRGQELRDMTVGVIGTGRIGAAVIDRLRAFGCRILATDSAPKISAEYVSIGELLRRSDLVTLHTPLNPATYHLLNREQMDQMKHGAFIVNTGRGPLLDTGTLLGALESGRLGGAALDVLEEEEGVFYTDWRNKPIESKLLQRLHELPNVLITPHTAYYTDHALRDMVENSVINCLNFAGREP
jgi:D-specific alpha-keto acid dehydrogenase